MITYQIESHLFCSSLHKQLYKLHIEQDSKAQQVALTIAINNAHVQYAVNLSPLSCTSDSLAIHWHYTIISVWL